MSMSAGLFYKNHGLDFFPKSVVDSLKNKSVITAGAFWGDSCLLFKEYFEKVYACEPMSFTILEEFVKGNNLENIDISNVGFHSENKEMDIRFNKDNIDSGSSVIEKAVSWMSKSKKIKVVNISDFVREKGIDNLGLLHLDIEGAEYEAITGAEEIIRKYKPLLLISLYHTDKDFFEIKPLIESWNLGYKFEIRHVKPNMHYYETVLLGYIET